MPDLTLVIVETQFKELARLALDDSEEFSFFKETVAVSDSPDWLRPGERFVEMPPQPSAAAQHQYEWAHQHEWFSTSHALFVQYDSWIIDPDAWRDDFLAYDYIAPPFGDDHPLDVGTGGFCITSRRLLEYVAARPAEFPSPGTSQDIVLCREYRPVLEAAGFAWAPIEIASAFGFEKDWTQARERHFGFHGMRMWPAVLNRQRLLERLRLCTDYHHRTRKVDALLAVYGRMEANRLAEDARWGAHISSGLGERRRAVV